MEIGGSIDQIISSFRPPIFWKDKEVVKNQISKWNLKDTEKLKFINTEHTILKKQLEKNVKSDEKLDFLYQSLKEINSNINLKSAYPTVSFNQIFGCLDTESMHIFFKYSKSSFS